jgi:hypothetical protein
MKDFSTTIFLTRGSKLPERVFSVFSMKKFYCLCDFDQFFFKYPSQIPLMCFFFAKSSSLWAIKYLVILSEKDVV